MRKYRERKKGSCAIAADVLINGLLGVARASPRWATCCFDKIHVKSCFKKKNRPLANLLSFKIKQADKILEKLFFNLYN